MCLLLNCHPLIWTSPNANPARWTGMPPSPPPRESSVSGPGHVGRMMDAKMADWQEPSSPQLRNLRCQQRCECRLKCLCTRIRCKSRQSGAHSCLMRQLRADSNCTIEVSWVDWDGYIQTRNEKAMRLLASLYSSAITGSDKGRQLGPLNLCTM